MSDIYLSLTETPSVVTLSQPVIASSVAATVTVGNTVTVALDANSLSALENVTVTVGAAISVSNFPATQVVSVGNFPASQVVTGTVALDSASLAALENVTVTVGAAVTVAGFSTSSLPPSTVTVANTVTINGTVTANIGQVVGLVDGPNPDYGVLLGMQTGDNEFKLVGHSGGLPIRIQEIGFENAMISVTSAGVPVIGTITVDNSVTIGSLPAISGTVTAYAVGKYAISGNTFQDKNIATDANGQTLINAIVNAQSVFSYDGQSHIFAKLTPNTTVTIGNSVTIGSLPAISGTVTANLNTIQEGAFGAYDSGSGTAINQNLTVVRGSDAALWLQDGGGNVPISGTVTASISTFPRPTWTDYSGTVVTANSAVTAISTVTRSYLLAQVTTGQMFLNIGATATTLNSVYFSAGQGFAWETSVPQGLVSIISAVTGTNYVLKDG